MDRIMREACGFRMGPFELMDLTGIDVNFPVTRYIYQSFQHDPRLKTTILHEALFNAGRFGQKSGEGFHAYANGARLPEPDSGLPVPAPSSMSVFLADQEPGLASLTDQGLNEAGQADADIILIAPKGEDAATASVRLALDPKRVVAVDLVGAERKFITLMAPVGGDGRIEKLAAILRTKGYAVATIKDSPGFVAPRILSMIANLACEVAQMGIGTPESIDTAMRLAQNYPRGPFEWAAWLGPGRVFETLSHIQSITGSDRYRPSLWLRRRAQLGLPIDTAP
jgi:3-hydroxybutyryl-CoA dehydrogenase